MAGQDRRDHYAAERDGLVEVRAGIEPVSAFKMSDFSDQNLKISDRFLTFMSFI